MRQRMKLGNSTPEGEKHRQFDRELGNMISALTRTIADRPSSGSSRLEEEDEHGFRIITLSGTNTGATMRSEHDDRKLGGGLDDYESDDGSESDALRTFVNSNFQAVNNSIMIGGSYNTNDPGVHLDVSDVFDCAAESYKPSLKMHKKGKAKKDKADLKSNQRSD